MELSISLGLIFVYGCPVPNDCCCPEYLAVRVRVMEAHNTYLKSHSEKESCFTGNLWTIVVHFNHFLCVFLRICLGAAANLCNFSSTSRWEHVFLLIVSESTNSWPCWNLKPLWKIENMLNWNVDQHGALVTFSSPLAGFPHNACLVFGVMPHSV